MNGLIHFAVRVSLTAVAIFGAMGTVNHDGWRVFASAVACVLGFAGLHYLDQAVAWTQGYRAALRDLDLLIRERIDQ